MSNIKKLMMTAAGGEALNVEDVFSTYVYKGNGTTQTITNGIDLAGEGGLVWIKSRNIISQPHVLFDTDRGVTKSLSSNSINAEYTASASNEGLSSFNSDGFTAKLFQDQSGINNASVFNASWTFRKAPKFFDVVTYTGNGQATNTISHNLGSTPGMVIVKSISSNYTWYVAHRSIPNEFQWLAGDYASSSLPQTKGKIFASDFTSTTFMVREGTTNGNDVNVNGGSYIAYVFAHNDGDGEFGPTGDQDIIKCGSYTGNGSTTGTKVDVGFLPQFVVVKATSRTGGWKVYDTMRGFTDTVGTPNGDPDKALTWNTNAIESAGTAMRPYIDGAEQGFQLQQTSVETNASGATYIYMAIRRGPMAIPTSSADVFDVTTYTADNTDDRIITTNNKVDTVLARNRNNTSERGFNIGDRIRGDLFLPTTEAYGDGYDTDSFMGFDHSYGFEVGNDPTRRLNYSNYTQLAYTWTRANSFYDVALYEGAVSNQNITHNLGVTPEMMWLKSRSVSNNWFVYHKDIDTLASLDDGYATLNSNTAANDLTFLPEYIFNQTAPTSTQFSLGAGNNGVNRNGHQYIAYLFASLPGVSKVGSYTGTGGTDQTIDCGFSAGARFILIKRIDTTGDWYVFDSERGFGTGQLDPYLLLNSTAAESSSNVLSNDSSGFIVKGTDINNNGGSYIFYAIA